MKGAALVIYLSLTKPIEHLYKGQKKLNEVQKDGGTGLCIEACYTLYYQPLRRECILVLHTFLQAPVSLFPLAPASSLKFKGRQPAGKI
jgi:hypothetical protein